tara:strand:- start:1252 stop:1476 length:225 start_codon:yes stop_codon:yes gene_type:complete
MKESSNYREIVSEFREYGTPVEGSRLALIMSTKYGYEVDLYEEDKKVRTINVHDHSVSYAEDCAENWCQRIIKN